MRHSGWGAPAAMPGPLGTSVSTPSFAFCAVDISVGRSQRIKAGVESTAFVCKIRCCQFVCSTSRFHFEIEKKIDVSTQFLLGAGGGAQGSQHDDLLFFVPLDDEVGADLIPSNAIGCFT